MNLYTEAEELIKNYRFEKATQLLNESLKIFNKNQQKKVVVSILLKLRKISNFLNNEGLAHNYLQNALEVAKSGEVPIDYIIKIHHKLGISYFRKKEYENALNHFKIIINFLENEDLSFIKEDYIGLAYLYIGLIYLDQNKIIDSKDNFKRALEIGNKLPRVRLKYFLTRAKRFKNQGNLSQAQRFLKAGLTNTNINFEDNNYLNVLIDYILELAEFYIHYRKDSKRAMFYLNSIENYLSPKEITNIERAIRWNLLMSDYCKIMLRNNQKAQFYVKQTQKLKNQLQKIRVNEQ